MTPPHKLAAPRLAIRCDGDERTGAGHVARCLPLAVAMERLGWRVSFVGAYSGLAAWLLERAGGRVTRVEQDSPCGVRAERYDAAIVDSYELAPESICALAQALPLATIAEANRCAGSGVLLDYHLDRPAACTRELIAGARFAPLDPAFAGAGHAGKEVRGVLVTLGGSSAAQAQLGPIASLAASAFAQADILLAAGPESETNVHVAGRVHKLPAQHSLLEVLGRIDLAVSAAGLTSYELACAGVPQLAIALAANQRRVVSGLQSCKLALCLDFTRGEGKADIPAALRELRDPRLRARLSRRGIETFDGGGAKRAAQALSERLS